MRTNVRILVAGCIALGLSCSACEFLAADIIHSDVMGSDVSFTGITEGSPTGDPLALYGQPIAAGNGLVFSPTAGFSAASIAGAAADNTDGKLTLMLEAKPGAAMSAIHFAETGVTSLSAPFGGDAVSSVNAVAHLQVLEIAGAPVSTSALHEMFSFSPANTFQYLVDATGPSFSTNWAGSLDVDLPAQTTKVLVTVDNLLFAATTGTASSALIDKKTFRINVSTHMPEPGTISLALMCLCGIVSHRPAVSRMR